MEIETKYWGKKEIKEDNILNFNQEILAFPDLLRYVLIEEKDTPFFWLQSLDEKDVCFVLMNPYLAVPDYQPKVEVEVLTELEAESIAELHCYTLVVVPDDMTKIRTNLQAPIVVNWNRKLACQVVLTQNDYPIRYYIFDALHGGEQHAGTDTQGE